jgi:hypothetical protein
MKVSCLLIRYRWYARFLLIAFTPFGIPICNAEIPGYPPSVFDYDAREIAMLPRYCKHAQIFRHRVPGGDNPIEIERWYTVMGGTLNTGPFHHMQHYCWGLMKTNRALILASNRQDRQFYLTDSLSEFDYVIQRVSPDFVLLPEIHTKKGENLLHLGRTLQGIGELQRAIELKPDYWPPYAAASDYFKKSKDIAKAREWLEKGVLASPDSKALQQRLAELGGGKGQQSASPQQLKTQSPPPSAVVAPPELIVKPEPPDGR